MRSPWYRPIVLETLDSSWDSSPATAGVYMILRDRPIPRIGGVDNMGIIYIGMATNLRERLWSFWKVKHTASDFLWTHKAIAQIVLNKPKLNVSDLKKHLGKLKVRYSTPIGEGLLDSAERALLFTYIEYFGEPPPLNMSLPKRWDRSPPSEDQEWAGKGLFD